MRGCNPNETKAEQLVADRIEWVKMFLDHAQREAGNMPDGWIEAFGDDFTDGIYDLKAMLNGENRKESK